ncbi:DNA mismatch repair endonuclease MutL [Candidatus Moranella endobia]|uniref:DNA mismatch repair protein MutL n=1 Tax=Moranella endobia (strain PCIT) TaxID=903503 RepID=F7XXC4_MOREP|nr:DNA mismatch repair endonuclease MutL [Candidatus Moranella endobia]AEI74750.1 putative DNA mismatch repair protein mutL [Candidatus Moranella endobia PCIT]
MPIQVLLPQLANQIAAGEVVSRPASVVKELIENSLDAGATSINIDIAQGGTKSIRIRDNGSGIPKEELALALARHATSKIARMEDLERITSMGFRGEALASISSVSRLYLTSRMIGQSKAWQVYAEGSELAVTIKPAAHPVGTTIEVLDLFYNTPARRKFMSTAKTEFTYIDDITRRIALSRFDVTFILQHNGKIVRQYRAISHKYQHQRRLVGLCGQAFVERAMGVSYHNSNLAIHGWIANTAGVAIIPELKYSYVNRRTMNDKFITHIIRKAYQEQFTETQQPAFVLFLEIDPQQIDVNFHPTKHKVRFYQDRLVHDFIYQAVANTLKQNSAPPSFVDVNEPCVLDNKQDNEPNNISSVIAEVANKTRVNSNLSRSVVNVKNSKKQQSKKHSTSSGNSCSTNDKKKKDSIYHPVQKSTLTLLYNEQNAQQIEPKTEYCSSSTSNNKELLNNRKILSTFNVVAEKPFSTELKAINYTESFGKILTLIEYCYALIKSMRHLALISLPVAERYLNEHQLLPVNALMSAQPLIIPLHITLCAGEIVTLKKHQLLMQEMGIYLQPDINKAILHTVPLLLSKQNLHKLIPKMLRYLSNEVSVTHQNIAVWLARRLQPESSIWSYSQAIQLLTKVEQFCPQWVQNPPYGLMVKLNFENAIKAMNYD